MISLRADESGAHGNRGPVQHEADRIGRAEPGRLQPGGGHAHQARRGDRQRAVAPIHLALGHLLMDFGDLIERAGDVHPLLCNVKSRRSSRASRPVVAWPAGLHYHRRMAGYANAHLLTTPADLVRDLDGDARPLVIDLRPPEDFAAGHIPGAVHLDLWGVSLIDTDPAPLKAFMWMIDHLFNLRGVDAKTPVVVYDEQSGMRAARAFWFLEYFGHPRVQVLDGGFGAWIRAGLPVTREAAPPPKSAGPARRRSRRSRPGAT